MAGRTDWCGWCSAPMPAQPYARCAICGYVARPPCNAGAAPHYGRPARGWSHPEEENRVTEKYTTIPANAGPLMVARKVVNKAIPVAPSFPSAYGKKRALLIGITYRRTRGRRLEGAVNDVNCISYLLQQKFGFPQQCILVLTDEGGDPSRMPTRDNIVAAMRWLVQGPPPGASLVFYFSGHGSRQRDQDGDELDSYDETLLPMDYENNRVIVDDMVNETLVRPLPQGVKLHAIVDACHSGSALDLPYVYNISRNEWEKFSRSYKGTRGGLAICFSSCSDSQRSSETTALSGRTMTGAMTYCFIEAVKSGTGLTYDHILRYMQRAIRDVKVGVFRSRLSQVTTLSSSEKFDAESMAFTL